MDVLKTVEVGGGLVLRKRRRRRRMSCAVVSDEVAPDPFTCSAGSPWQKDWSPNRQFALPFFFFLASSQ